MSNAKNLSVLINEAFNFQGENVVMETTIANGTPVRNCITKAPLKIFNRHGLIAGATGTVNIRTLQSNAEKLSAVGVPTSDYYNTAELLTSLGISSDTRSAMVPVGFKV